MMDGNTSAVCIGFLKVLFVGLISAQVSVSLA